LLFSSEQGFPSGGIWQATTDFPSRVENLLDIIGSSAYEGMQADNQENIIIAEDASGGSGSAAAGLSHAKQPNSFIYRFIPYNTSDLKVGGKLQALQVMSHAHSGPIVFHAGAAVADIKSQDTKDRRTYGSVFQTNWVQIHDTAGDGFAPFNANALAKARLATPFKRPENGQFRPSSNFSEFVFDETGDTDIQTEAGSDYAGSVPSSASSFWVAIPDFSRCFIRAARFTHHSTIARSGARTRLFSWKTPAIRSTRSAMHWTRLTCSI
jgi:hypothetical protein